MTNLKIFPETLKYFFAGGGVNCIEFFVELLAVLESTAFGVVLGFLVILIVDIVWSILTCTNKIFSNNIK